MSFKINKKLLTAVVVLFKTFDTFKNILGFPEKNILAKTFFKTNLLVLKHIYML